MSYLQTEADPILRKGMRWSFIGHVCILMVVILKGLIFPDTKNVYVPALRVDVVALPDVLKKDLGKVSPKKAKTIPKKSKPKEMVFKTKSKKERAKESALARKKRKAKLGNAIDRIRALEKIKEEEQEQTSIVKGNQLSGGTQLTGEAREKAEATYTDLLVARIKEHWTLPTWLARRGLDARVRIYVDSRGRIERSRFEKSSGFPQFDEAVSEALKNAEPLPPPPPEILHSLRVEGVGLGFPL